MKEKTKINVGKSINNDLKDILKQWEKAKNEKENNRLVRQPY